MTNKMPDSKVEVKACLRCGHRPNTTIRQSDKKVCVICSNLNCFISRVWCSVEEWNARPIANNGVSLEDIRNAVTSHCSHPVPQKWDGSDCQECEKIVQDIAKLPTTAPRGGKET